jgi:glycosyltransferase involved in cell wall biosynthesis
MRISFICPSFYPAFYYGGPIYSTYELAKGLKKQNIDIKVISTNSNGKEKLDIKTNLFQKLDNLLPVKYYNSLDSNGTSIRMFFNLWKDIRDVDIIYLISIFSPTTPLTLISNIIYRKKIIISPRGQLGKWCLEQGNWYKKLWLTFFIAPFIHHLHWHLTSEDEQNDVKAIYPKSKTFVIPNGIDLNNFNHFDSRKEKSFYSKYAQNLNRNSAIIVSMGRLHKKKGFDTLIEAIKKVKEQFNESDILLFIAGEDFGEKENLLNQIQQLRLQDTVFLIGYIDGEEKNNFLKNADLFALPSHDENFGIVYAEALAAATPVIASTNTPWRDVVKYDCGKWVKNTKDEFARAIIEILNADTIKMGLNGKQYVEENFSWNFIASDFNKKCITILKSS